jgi:hypothetical protein
MNWNFWKKKKPNPLTVSEISTRLRGFLLDAQLPQAHEMALHLGCSPISDDVALMEEEESDKRLEYVSVLTPLLFALSHSLAEATVEVNKGKMEDAENLPDEVWTHSRRLLEQVSLAVLIGGISQLVDMGFLDLNKRFRKRLF